METLERRQSEERERDEYHKQYDEANKLAQLKVTQRQADIAEAQNGILLKQIALDRQVVLLTICIAVVGLLALCAAGWQAWESRRSADATIEAVTLTRTNFQQDQRPYIWFTESLGAPKFVSQTGQVIWTYHFTNYGRSPAYKLRSTEMIKVGDRPFTRSHGTFEFRESPILPTGKDDFSTAVSNPGIPEEEWNRLLGISKSIRIKIMVEYADISGNLYTETLCVTRLNTGAIGYCTEADSK